MIFSFFFVAVWNAWRILRECNNTAAAVSVRHQTNSHTAFLCPCSLARCCYPGAPRSVISTSMEEHASCVKFQGSRTCSLSLYLHELPPDPTVNSECVRSVDTATSNSSSEVQVNQPVMKCCLGFFFLFLMLRCESVARPLVCHSRRRFYLGYACSIQSVPING